LLVIALLYAIVPLVTLKSKVNNAFYDKGI